MRTQSRRHRFFSRFIMGVAAGAATGSAASGDGTNPPEKPVGYHYFYFKSRKELPLDQTRVAVYQSKPRPMEQALRNANLNPDHAALFPVAGWTLVTLPIGIDDAGLRRIVESLARSDSLDFVSPVFKDTEGGPLIITKDLLVGFDPAREAGGNEEVLAASGAGLIADRDWAGLPGVYRLGARSRNGFEVLASANTLAQRPEVTFAEPDVIFSGHTELIPNDEFFSQCWGIHNTGQSGGTVDMDMDGPEAWDITTGSNSIIVVIIDTGVQSTHPDLNLRLPGTDTTIDMGDGNPINPCDKHGTAVAGCVSAIVNNSVGGVGIAPGCRSASARTFISRLSPCDGGWNTQASWTVNSLAWAQSIGARVTNNSNIYGFTSAAIDTAYANTWNAGIIHFACAGNNGSSTLAYPASIPIVNSVAALSRTGARASFSQFGVGLDFSAPGMEILSTDRTGADGYNDTNYAVVNGTSFASPYAAGVAALILSQNPALTPAQVESRMQTTCINLGPAGYDTDFGWGFVNALAALQAGVPPVPPNDACANAISVSAQGEFNGTLVGAANDGTATCGSSAPNPDVWYSFTAPAGCPGVLRVSTCGTHDMGGVDSGVDTVLSVLAACGGGAQLACNDNALGGVCAGSDSGLLRDSALSLTLNGGQTVRIRVSKFGATAVGPFVLRVAYGPANDLCANAVTVSNGSTPFCTIGAVTDGPSEPAACNFFGNPAISQDVWFRYTATCTGTVAASLCGSAFDTEVAIYPNSCPTAAGTVSACNDNALAGAPCAGSVQSYVTFTASSGATYLVRIGGFQTASGTGTLSLSCAASCPCDWNHSGQVSSQDFFDFLAGFFVNNADYNMDGMTASQDFFDFLACFFGGC